MKEFIKNTLVQMHRETTTEHLLLKMRKSEKRVVKHYIKMKTTLET